MCGLIGFSGANPFNIDRIHKLILANITRGVDATGVYCNGKIVKATANAIEFLAKNPDPFTPDTKFLGHCRAGTVGSKTDPKNAHPFQYGNVIGKMLAA